MSLDVYLVEAERGTCFECGHRTKNVYFYEANITHNLNSMADEAGIYEALWRPEEIGAKAAGHLIEPLRKGLAKLKAEPERFMKFNPPNGWGNYEELVGFVEKYFAACKENPDATIQVSR